MTYGTIPLDDVERALMEAGVPRAHVHVERFGVPGKTLLGADSHTPGAAGVSMLGIGAGGLDVALAMARTLGAPAFVVLGLSSHAGTNDRHHAFFLESAFDVLGQLAERGIAGVLHLERRRVLRAVGDPRAVGDAVSHTRDKLGLGGPDETTDHQHAPEHYDSSHVFTPLNKTPHT